jgi:hypothetical protein
MDFTVVCTERKLPFMCSFSGNCVASVSISTFVCLRAIYLFPGSIYSQDRSTYFPATGKADRSWKYINLSQIYECRNWETEHYNSVLEISVSFLGIHRWEPDIYIGFLTGPSFAVCLGQPLRIQHLNLNSYQSRQEAGP